MTGNVQLYLPEAGFACPGLGRPYGDSPARSTETRAAGTAPAPPAVRRDANPPRRAFRRGRPRSRGERTTGTILGAAAGALLGRELEKELKCR
jgi:hypothetical protein